jgi:AcrR family transcriptional regulator
LSVAPKARRTLKEDWLDAGLTLLREGGEDALTIDNLCAPLGRTKGSFYHHFADAAAFLDALLQHWADKQTEAPIIAAESGRTARQRRQKLEASVRQLDMKLDLAVRAWALRDPRARKVLREVDARRVAYLEGLHRSAMSARGAGAARVEPLVLARLEYAAFVGAQQLFPHLQSKEAIAVEDALRLALDHLSS